MPYSSSMGSTTIVDHSHTTKTSAMGTDVAGVGGEPNTSPYAKVRAKVSVNPDQEVDPKLPEENKEVKDFEVTECTSEAPRAENSLEKSSSAGKLSSGEVLAENMKLKIAEQTPSDVTIDKQVCGIPRPVETPDLPTESSSKSPYSTKKSLVSGKVLPALNGKLTRWLSVFLLLMFQLYSTHIS